MLERKIKFTEQEMQENIKTLLNEYSDTEEVGLEYVPRRVIIGQKQEKKTPIDEETKKISEAFDNALKFLEDLVVNEKKSSIKEIVLPS